MILSRGALPGQGGPGDVEPDPGAGRTGRIAWCTSYGRQAVEGPLAAGPPAWTCAPKALVACARGPWFDT